MIERSWQPIETAPQDGSPIEIKGLTFLAEDEYTAIAAWGARPCPEHVVQGWFPATDKHDGQGDYERVFEWRPLEMTSNV